MLIESRLAPASRRGSSVRCRYRAYRDARRRARGSPAAVARARQSSGRSALGLDTAERFAFDVTEGNRMGSSRKGSGGTRARPCNRLSVASSRRTNSRPIVLRTHQPRGPKSLTTQSRASSRTRQRRGFAQRPSRSSVRGAGSKVGRSNRGKRSGKRGGTRTGSAREILHPARNLRGGADAEFAQDRRTPYVRPTCWPNGSPNG